MEWLNIDLVELKSVSLDDILVILSSFYNVITLVFNQIEYNIFFKKTENN